MSWEVRTMRSATSYFNFTLLRKNFARFWPIWSLYGLFWLAVLPLNILSNRIHWDGGMARSLPLNYLDGGPSAAVTLTALFGLLCAMAVFSYLYASRSVGMLHALPLRREGLFLTNYLSGLLFLLLPNLAVFLLALAAEVFAGTVVFSSLFTWLVVVSLFGLFFYSFAVFCAMFTGHVLALPAFYVVLNGLAAGLCWVFSRMAEEFLFGFTSAAWLEKLGVWLTPVLLLSEACHVQYDTITDAAGNSMLGDPYFAGLGYASLYALIGLVLAGLALAAYRRRHLESAGDVVSVRWVRPVFKYGVAFCTAVTLSTVFYYVLDPLLPRGPWTLLVLMVVWGAAGCFVAEMLLCKSFWVFRGAWKGCVVFLCCLTAAMCAMEFDIIGFEGRVPDVAEVQSAHLSGVESAPYDDLGYATLTLDTPEELEAMHGMKTGALIRASAVLGCLAACAPRDVILQADLYAAKIGLAFQIVDDILDVTETSEELGKSASDAENHKTTYITLYGVEKAREMVRRLVLEADLAVKGTMLDDEMLYELADTLAKRNH